MAIVPYMKTTKNTIQLLLRDAFVIPRQLIDDRVRKQHEICLLPHIADVMALPFSGLSQEQDLPRCRHIQSGQKIHQRGFPCPIEAHERIDRPLADRKRESMQRFLLRALIAIAEISSLEYDGCMAFSFLSRDMRRKGNTALQDLLRRLFHMHREMGQMQEPAELHRLRLAETIGFCISEHCPCPLHRSVIDESPFIHAAEARKIPRQLIHTVLHHEDRHMVFPIQGNQKLQEILDALRIHLAHWLIQNKKLRMRHKDRGQRKTLPLPAGERMDTPRLHTGKPRLCKRTPDLFLDDRRILSAIFESKSDLIGDRHRKELVIGRLIHRACQKPDIFRAHLCHVPSIERDRPREPCFPRFQKTCDTLDERRFPAAGAPCDEDHLSFGQ